MEDQLIAKFASFRAGMRQWERRINDEELAERDNFLKWVKGAFGGATGVHRWMIQQRPLAAAERDRRITLPSAVLRSEEDQ
jgi:hypothetical protein